jgi:UDP-N-acetylglucosamine 2-epimerase (non-hydrolysing)/GDP/UDP-N,N'-diacetylbacillosamine 2-epimerase (hydrolysing)
MHLSPEFGLTYRGIEADGFKLDAKVEMLLSSDTAVGAAKSLALAVAGMAEAFDRLQPDIIILVGDRYETLAAAQAALLARIPVAHLFGGDVTEGAVDDAIRHSITKMSHLHFVSTEKAARRVRQLGENPESIHNVGSIGIDGLFLTPRLSRAEVEEKLGFRLRLYNLLVTFHPVTLEPDSARQLGQLLEALSRLKDDFGIIFTLPNADVAGREMASDIQMYAASRSNCTVHAALGSQLYASTMSVVDAVVGNSSSGLYEAPSLKKPTVNIGNRQLGREQAASVLNCPPEADAIEKTIHAALAMDCRNVVNPYGDGRATERIVACLKQDFSRDLLVKKCFFDLPE